jgi:hypothetical protein
MPRALTALLLLGAAACTELALAAPLAGLLDFRAWSAWGEAGPGLASGPRVEAEGGSGRIVVRGRVRTPSPCQALTGLLVPLGRELRLEVVVRPVGDGCADAIGAFDYRAELRRLPPGEYTVRVRYLYPGTGWETLTALERTVKVR